MAAKEEFERACSKSPERAKYWFYDALSRSWGFMDDNYYDIEKFFALATEQDKLQLGSEYGINLHNYTTFCVYIASKRAKMSGDEARRFGSAPRCGNPKDCEVDAVTVKAYTDAFAALSDAEKLIFARLTINNLYSILKPHLSEDFEKEFARSAEKALNTGAGGYFFINYPEAFTDGEGVMRIDADKLFPAQAKRNICIGTVRGVRRLDIHGTCLVSCNEKIPAVSFDIGTEEMWKMWEQMGMPPDHIPEDFRPDAPGVNRLDDYLLTLNSDLEGLEIRGLMLNQTGDLSVIFASGATLQVMIDTAGGEECWRLMYGSGDMDDLVVYGDGAELVRPEDYE
jgi:hypothetical protein